MPGGVQPVGGAGGLHNILGQLDGMELAVHLPGDDSEDLGSGDGDDDDDDEGGSSEEGDSDEPMQEGDLAEAHEVRGRGAGVGGAWPRMHIIRVHAAYVAGSAVA